MTHPLMADVQRASEVLRQRLPASPLLEVPTWRTAAGRGVWLKAESLMPTGSFKIRGATYRISLLSQAERARGVVAYSTGNHAQAVAKAASDAGVSALIVMSPDVPAAKIAATEAWGARVVLAEASSDARRALAERLAVEEGRILIPPYDDPHVIAGQASIAVELQRQWAGHPPAAVFVPIGGGGLIAGVALALKHLEPTVRVIGVEPELEDDAARSFRAGRIVAASGPSDSIADAIKVQRPGEITFPLIQAFVDDIVTVSEADIARAALRSFAEARLVVEPGGAVGIAAALQAKHDGPVVALACGGNVTLERLEGLRQRYGANP